MTMSRDFLHHFPRLEIDAKNHDYTENGKLSEFGTILAESNPDELTEKKQALEKFRQRVAVLARYLAGEVEEDIADVLEISRDTLHSWLKGYVENGKLSEFNTILAESNPDELTEKKQAMIEEYFGSHLLDPDLPQAMWSVHMGIPTNRPPRRNVPKNPAAPLIRPGCFSTRTTRKTYPSQ
jgi:transposase